MKKTKERNKSPEQGEEILSFCSLKKNGDYPGCALDLFADRYMPGNALSNLLT
tara:strand:+ start:7524 stop:7682 length:159 start_codon:yes stop_codon:yes gene_type:complete